MAATPTMLSLGRNVIIYHHHHPYEQMGGNDSRGHGALFFCFIWETWFPCPSRTAQPSPSHLLPCLKPQDLGEALLGAFCYANSWP